MSLMELMDGDRDDAVYLPDFLQVSGVDRMGGCLGGWPGWLAGSLGREQVSV